MPDLDTENSRRVVAIVDNVDGTHVRDRGVESRLLWAIDMLVTTCRLMRSESIVLHAEPKADDHFVVCSSSRAPGTVRCGVGGGGGGEIKEAVHAKDRAK